MRSAALQRSGRPRETPYSSRPALTALAGGAGVAPRAQPPFFGSTPTRRGLEILIVWTVVGIFIAAQRYLRAPSLQPRLALPLWESLGASLVTAYLWAMLTPTVMRAARRFRPRRGRLLATVPALLLGGAAVALAHLVATNVFWQLASPLEAPGDFTGMLLATLAFGGTARLATYFAIAGVTWGVDDYRIYREKELEASELERELVGTQLEALKLRLHPPFLFNTLATILPLIQRDPRAAARTVVQLGDILRLTLHNEATGMVPLKTELEYLRLYLQIEQTRLQDRIEVHFSIEPEILDAAVPSLVLLPLVESAIANGVSVRPGRGRIDIRARREGEWLGLSIGEAPLDPEEVPAAVPIDDSFVRRTKARLELLYPGVHRLTIADGLEKGHSVSLALPLSATAAVESAGTEAR